MTQLLRSEALDRLFSDAQQLHAGDMPMDVPSSNMQGMERSGRTQLNAQPDNMALIGRLTGNSLSPVELRYFDNSLEFAMASSGVTSQPINVTPPPPTFTQVQVLTNIEVVGDALVKTYRTASVVNPSSVSEVTVLEFEDCEGG